MKSCDIILLLTGAGAPAVADQRGPWAWGGGGAGGGAGGPPCVSQCWDAKGSQDWSQNGWNGFCSNTTAIDEINSCVGGSSCSDADKQATYQFLAQICAAGGNPITASPEASYSATSGGFPYPTGTGSWASWASASGPGGPGGWHKGGAGYGPFGAGAPGNGYGPWASSGAWVDGPWTKWWGDKACPPSTWSGWTSDWSTSAPWTTWTACTAETTGTTVVTTTTISNGTATPVTTTDFGLRVAEATSSSNATSGPVSSSASTAIKRVSPGLLGVLSWSITSVIICLASL